MTDTLDQCAAPDHDLARLARSSGGARPAGGDPAERRAQVRARGDRQAARRHQGDVVPAAGRARDAGDLRARLRPAMDRRGDGRRAGRRARAVPGRRAQSAAVERGQDRAGAGGGASRGRSRQAAAAADAQRARQRRLHHRRAGDRAQSGDRHPERLDPPAAAQRAEPIGRAAAAAPHPHVLRGGRTRSASRSTSRSSSASIRSRCCRRRRSRRSISTS